MIKADKIYKHYGNRTVLRDIFLEVHPKEFVCLVGESGSGKTTILRMFAGLDQPSRGKIEIEGQELDGINEKAAMVFQSFALLPWLTVKENIVFPFNIQGLLFDDNEIQALINEVGLRGFEHRYPRDLSGGQKQRVGIARALAVKRNILLLDEPFSALDIKTATELCNDLLALWQQNKLTVVMVSHLVEEAVELADRVIVIKNGEIRSRIKIDLPRARNTESKEFLEIVDHIKQIIEVG